MKEGVTREVIQTVILEGGYQARRNPEKDKRRREQQSRGNGNAEGHSNCVGSEADIY